MSLSFHSIAHAHRMRSKIEDDPDFFEGLTLTGEYESLGKLASRTYVVQRWLGDEDQIAERLCYDVCRTRSFEWLSEIHQPLSTNPFDENYKYILLVCRQTVTLVGTVCSYVRVAGPPGWDREDSSRELGDWGHYRHIQQQMNFCLLPSKQFDETQS